MATPEPSDIAYLEIWKGVSPFAVAVFSSVVSALLSGYLFSRYKSFQDQLEKRCDDLCNHVSTAGELANLYWKSDQKELHSAKEVDLETKILAKLHAIGSLRVAIEKDISASAKDSLAQAEASLMRELTGGDFGIHNRTADIQRAKASIMQAAMCVTTIRAARLEDMRGWRQRS